MSNHDSLSESSKTRKSVVMRGFGTFLFVIMMGLTGVVLFLWVKNYESMEKTQILLQEVVAQQTAQFKEVVSSRNKWQSEMKQSIAELDLEAQQHAATKALLLQSNDMLSSARLENDMLSESIIRLEELRDQQTEENLLLENKIASLKQKNDEVRSEIKQLTEKLEQYNTDIGDLDEGRDVIGFFKEKIREVKLGIHQIKRKTYLAKVEAQKERDRLEFLAGNNGFVKKDGEWTDPNPPEIDASMINIDVQFVK